MPKTLKEQNAELRKKLKDARLYSGACEVREQYLSEKVVELGREKTDAAKDAASQALRASTLERTVESLKKEVSNLARTVGTAHHLLDALGIPRSVLGANGDSMALSLPQRVARIK